MPGFARHPIALTICCLVAAGTVAHAEEEVAASATADNAPLSLRKERRFNVQAKRKSPSVPTIGIEYPALARPNEVYPLFVIADRIYGRADEVTEAEGNVELRKTGSQVFSERASYHLLDDLLDATGKVRLLQDGGEVLSPHLRMKMTEQVGFAEQANYQMVREKQSRFYQPKNTVVTVASSNGNTSGAPMMLNVPNSYGLPTKAPLTRPSEVYGDASRINFEGENQMRLSQATFSTCKPGQTDWYMQASELHLDYDEDEGRARDASLWFKNVPLFYTPSASFPLNGQRRSGILHPHFSTSTRSGLDFTLPYYWNIAPNYDATLYPRYLSKRGYQLGGEVRYLDYNFQGFTRAEYLPTDDILGGARYAYNIQHQHNLGNGFSGLVNWNGVSDDTYWQDFSSRLLRTSQTQLPKQLQLGYSPASWLQTSLQVLRYQTLQPDPRQPVARPYFLEPQLNVIGYKPDVLGTDISLIGQYSRFTHLDSAKDQGDRIVFYPQVSLPILHPAFQITPKIGLHLTQYQIDRSNASPYADSGISRVLPTFSLDSSLSFEREGNWFGSEYIQTLEPRLYYVNIPYRDQSRIPVFDTGLSDFNFAQIFSENRYTGYDRVNDANQLTAGLTTRLLDGTTGIERIKAMIGQRYYFKPQRVSIDGEVRRQEEASNLIAAVNGLVAPKTYADLAWEYNYRDNLSERFSAGARYQPDLGKVMSASYRYTRDPLTGKSIVDQVDMAGQWPISARWYVVGRYNWSLRDGKVLESIAGVEYNAGCWSARIVAQRLAALSGVPNETIFFQLELNDFGSIGSNPLGLLRRSIPGYGKTNELPGSGSLLSTQ